MKRNQHSWKDDLLPFAVAWFATRGSHLTEVSCDNQAANYFRKIADRMTPEAIALAHDAARRVTQTNCWFATYHAAKLFEEVIP